MKLTAKQGRGSKVHLSIDGEYVVTTSVNFWYSLGIPVETEITEEEWEALLSKINYQKLYSRALDSLSIRDHSKKELTDKLIKKFGFEVKEDIALIIDELVEKGLLDDERFAHAYAEELIKRKHASPAGLRAALSAKGISRDIISSVLEDVNIDTKATINELLDTKYHSRDLMNETQKTKVFNALVRLGFSYNDIKSVFYDRTKEI
ncbi:MAG: regulatory protein RecX [Ruminococcaceae bacterium]|nr:regulatory protein RecX [Oscillospiraceae bacterium]